MGVVIRQSAKIALATYLGVIIGYINVVILFPRILTTEQFGLTRILIAISMILVQCAQFGSGHIILRYFPFYKNKDNQHNGFLFFIFLLTSTGLLIFTSLLFLLKDTILSFYSVKSALLIEYYYFIIPIFGSLLFFRALLWYAQSIFKSVLLYYVKDIFTRAFNLCMLVLFFFGYLTFDQFIILFVLAYFLQLLISGFYIKHIGQLFVKPNFSIINFTKIKEMMSYGFVLFLSGTSSILLTNIDVLMLGALAGLSEVAVYSVAFFIGNIIQIPARSIKNVASPIISQAWKKNDKEQLNELYKKTSINQLTIGLFIFIGIWLNIDNIIQILPDKYADGKYVIAFIAMGQLCNMARGLNDEIIYTSKLYKFDLFINIFLVVTAIITNYIFIPIYGIIGAAMATALSVFLYSVIKTTYVIVKFKLFPFTFNSIKVLLIAIVVFTSAYLIPYLGNIWLDLGVRSLVIAVLFGSLTLWLKISEDINATVNKYLGKYKVS